MLDSELRRQRTQTVRELAEKATDSFIKASCELSRAIGGS